MRHLKPFLWTAALLILSWLCLRIAFAKAEPPAKAKWEGIYTVSGHDGRKGYSGVVMVKKLSDAEGGIYVVTWNLFDYGSMTGPGVIVGGKLCASWSLASLRGMHVIARTEKGAAAWWVSLPTTGKSSPETWTYLAPLPSVPDDLPQPDPDKIQ